ncbi:class I tRNA ligase family protein [Mycoplasma seminis]|uniref:Class I tRNA ligase family protein n=1 Tax=Mycoplasma seminis TaxID=512749 RepID=A0ABY9HAR4_9MOLU|nr:class I tRNA ligase family protein [Mycoplasma seminis]WLP85687.1 class I tRNA ligase family protein [Mycoplasma seminis]
MTKIYVCGPTVYNDVHIGNLRPIITMDLILKAYRALGKEFAFVHNITDIDDKIINKAIETNQTEAQVSSYYAEKYLEILKQFNVDTITHLEYVTQNMDLIIKFISDLISIGAAYQDKDGNVWFDVVKYKNNYGVVSNQNIDNMMSQESEFSANKKSPYDFALWKKTSVGIQYDSPFAAGRPGWHTECAVLIYKHFQNNGVDIHGGGMDLTFPHHENENIQFYALSGNNIAQKWLRTGQINLNGIKMSKSLQNVLLPKDFLTKFSPDVLKTIFIQNAFTSEINIDDATMESVNAFLNKIKKIYFLAAIENVNLQDYDTELFEKIMNTLVDIKFSDFNKEVNTLIKEINKTKEPKMIASLIKIFDSLGFEFSKFDYKKYLDVYKEWKQLLNDKNYTQADKLRAELIENNLI